MSRYEVRWTQDGAEMRFTFTFPDFMSDDRKLRFLRAARDEVIQDYPDAHIVERTETEEVIE